MGGNESFRKPEGQEAISVLKTTRAENLVKMPEKERKIVESIMTDMDVMKSSYLDNIENIDFSEPGNAKGLFTLARGAFAKMKGLNANKDIVDLYGTSLKILRDNMDKNDKKAILQSMRDMDTAALMFTSTVALETTRNVDSKTEEVNPVETKEKLGMSNYMPYLKNGLEKMPEIGTDSLNRAESMRYVYSAEPVDLSTFEGDQILLKTAIEKVFTSNRFKMSEGYQGMMDNINDIPTSDVPYILAAYQQLNYLKVDGKFGPQTFEALKKDAGVTIVDRSTGGEAVSKYKRFSEIDNYIDRAKKSPRKKVEKKEEAKESLTARDKEMIAKLNSDVYSMGELELSDLKNLIIERFASYGGDVDVFEKMLPEDQILREKMKFVLEMGAQSFQTEAVLDMLRNADIDNNGITLEETTIYGEVPKEDDLEGGMSKAPEDSEVFYSSQEQDMGSSEPVELEDMNQDMHGPDLPPEMAEEKNYSSIDDVE